MSSPEDVDPPRLDTKPRWGEVGIHGVHRQREWDGVVTLTAPGLRGDEAGFVVLEDGTVLVEDDPVDDDVSRLAGAVQDAVQPPLRAHAARRDGDVWVVAAKRLRVVAVPERVGGDEVVLSLVDGERTLVVDRRSAIQPLPTFERLGEDAGSSYSVVARRLDGDLWEVEVSPL